MEPKSFTRYYVNITIILEHFCRCCWFSRVSHEIVSSLKALAPINWYIPQVGFAEFNNTADNRANIGGTIIGAPIVGQ